MSLTAEMLLIYILYDSCRLGAFPFPSPPCSPTYYHCNSLSFKKQMEVSCSDIQNIYIFFCWSEIKPEPFLALVYFEPLISARREWHLHRSTSLPDTRARAGQQPFSWASKGRHTEKTSEVDNSHLVWSDQLGLYRHALFSQSAARGHLLFVLSKKVVCPRALKDCSN